MKAQNFLQKSNVTLAMNKENLEELINEETRRLVGYVMPILEGASMNEIQRSSVKKILYTYKNNLCAMLINEMSNEKSSKAPSNI
tara:strand:- start:1753 stop:2007 length:255 start_codon:yes stop_codon:yes gene_type:complete